MLRTFFRSTALGLALLILPLAAGAQTMYEVELLVFARPSADVKVETWPDQSELSPSEDRNGRALTTAASTSAETKAFQRLPGSALRLTHEYQRLAAASDFKPVLHLGWVQPGLAREEAVPVRIEGGTASAGSVEGTLRVVLSHYLHVETDLRYQRPEDARAETAEEDVLEQPQPMFRLKESRRMRSREIHYLDHPLFGALILITPHGG